MAHDILAEIKHVDLLACLIADVVQHFVDAKLDFDASYVYQDVKESLQYVHRSGLMHRGILADPHRYLGQVLRFLRSLREKGKKLFLLTNSPYYFVDGGMRFILEDSSGSGDSWRELFDVVIAHANKPTFYASEYPFRYVAGDAHLCQGCRSVGQAVLMPEAEVDDLTGWWQYFQAHEPVGSVGEVVALAKGGLPSCYAQVNRNWMQLKMWIWRINFPKVSSTLFPFEFKNGNGYRCQYVAEEEAKNPIEDISCTEHVALKVVLKLYLWVAGLHPQLKICYDIKKDTLTFSKVDTFLSGQVYYHGCLKSFLEITKWKGTENDFDIVSLVIYFGDHLFSDLRGPSKAGWRTAAIIHELESWGLSSNCPDPKNGCAAVYKSIGSPRESFIKLFSMAIYYWLACSANFYPEVKEDVAPAKFHIIQELLGKLHAISNNCNQGEAYDLLLNELNEERQMARTVMKSMFNTSFGATFLTDTGQESAFAYHIHQYADVYTSKPENFLLYSPEAWLHVPFDVKIMPHHVKKVSPDQYVPHLVFATTKLCIL
ncbi:hypothetical protein ACLOJK_002725 [Asimina triloba]